MLVIRQRILEALHPHRTTSTHRQRLHRTPTRTRKEQPGIQLTTRRLQHPRTQRLPHRRQIQTHNPYRTHRQPSQHYTHNMARGQTPALTPEQAQRYNEVIRLRALGLTFDEIATRTGYSDRSAAKNAYDAALKRFGRESVDSLRELEGFRLEDLWRRLMARLGSNEELTVGELSQLIAAGVRVSQRRANLFGLDAPRQVEVAGAGGGPVQTDIGQLLREKLVALRQTGELDAGTVIDVDVDE